MAHENLEDYIIKVFDTKERAENNHAGDALWVIGGTSVGTQQLITNYSASGDGPAAGIASTASSGSTGTTLKDTNASMFAPSMAADSQEEGAWLVEKVSGGATTFIKTYVSPSQVTLNANISIGDTDAFKIYGNPSSSGKNFFLYKKYYYRIEATNPCSGFIIDWDDGEDNSTQKANVQIIKLDTPQYYAITSHVYTKHSRFYPLVRTISPEGFYSKWYTSYGAQNNGSNTVSAIENRSFSYTPKDLSAQNNGSILSLDVLGGSNQNPRIPEFSPANIPPTAVLKCDRTAVFSGLDNHYINPTSAPHTNATAYAYIRKNSGRTGHVTLTDKVEVIYRTSTDAVYKDLITASSNVASCTKFPPTSGARGYLKEILSVKLLELRETTSLGTLTQLYNDERIWFLAYARGDSQAEDTDETITFLSTGCPIQTVDRPGFSLIANGSESQTKASNVSISKYLFSEGKLEVTSGGASHGSYPNSIQVPTIGNPSGDSIGKQVSDSFTFGNNVDFINPQNEPSKRINYTFPNPGGSGPVVDGVTSRFYEEERLIRLQVRDSSKSTRRDVADLDTFEMSFIEHWHPHRYGEYTTTAGLTPNEHPMPSNLRSKALLMYMNYSEDAVKWKDCITANGTIDGTAVANSSATGDPFLICGGTQKTSGGGSSAGSGIDNLNNDTELTYDGTKPTGHKENPTNYLLACRGTKWNKLHFRLDNSSSAAWIDTDIKASSDKISIVAWYSSPVGIGSTYRVWKPLPIVDGTGLGFEGSSLHRSGSITWEMPEDWVTTTSALLETEGGSTWAGPIAGMENDSTSSDPQALWDENMYGILIGIACDSTASVARRRVNNIYPYNNLHSQAIKIVDPHHKSLSDIGITSDISWSRSGKIMQITDRFGRSEMRKLGVNGGSITFGGVDLNTERKNVSKYQRESTPVYVDVERKNGEFIRFYGVISSLRETYPVGKGIPRYDVNFIVENVLEFDASGEWLSDGLLGLGGEIIDEPKYAL